MNVIADYPEKRGPRIPSWKHGTFRVPVRFFGGWQGNGCPLPSWRKSYMSIGTIILIILVIALLGGFYGTGYYGGGGLGLVVVILLILLLLGRL
jgi:hypothetical protein